MGTAKQLLPWPPQPEKCRSQTGSSVVAVSFDLLASHCPEMIVVLGHEANAVVAALGKRRFTAINADADAEMLESIKAGLRAAESLLDVRSALVHPADHPAVGTATIAAV